MKKVLLALLSIALAFTAMQPSQAQDQKVLAIIDTSIDSKTLQSVFYEACFTENGSCPNGKNFMEGSSAAEATGWKVAWPTSPHPDLGVSVRWPISFPKTAIDKALPTSPHDNIYHGDLMAKAALSVNPNVKIVFVRISNIELSPPQFDKKTNKLSRASQWVSSNRPESIALAVDWVSKNAEKYSIDALSISQAAVDKGNLSRCNVNSPNFDKVTTEAVSSLNAKNIPVFVATGNHARSDVVGWPSCTPGAIGVGALQPNISLGLEKSTNRGPGLDLIGIGKVSVVNTRGTKVDITGTSGVTAISASSYIAKNTFKTFQEYFNALPKITTNTGTYSSN